MSSGAHDLTSGTCSHFPLRLRELNAGCAEHKSFLLSENKAVELMVAAIKRKAPIYIFPWQLHLMVNIFAYYLNGCSDSVLVKEMTSLGQLKNNIEGSGWIRARGNHIEDMTYRIGR